MKTTFADVAPLPAIKIEEENYACLISHRQPMKKCMIFKTNVFIIDNFIIVNLMSRILNVK